MSNPTHPTDDAAPPLETVQPSCRKRSAASRTGKTIFGIVGWLTAGALILYALALPTTWKAKEARVRAELDKQRQENVGAGTAQIQTARDQRNAVMQTVNAEIEARNVIKQETADYQGRLLRLKDDQASLERDLAAKKAENKALGSSMPSKGMGRKVENLRRERNRLVAEYRVLLADLRREFQDRLNTRKPERMRQFYSARQNTPFGPAALFYAAEFLYESRNSKDAARLYKELLRKYPDSAYLDAVRTRQAQIQEHEPYVRKDDVGLYLYRPLIMNGDEAETNASPSIDRAL